jgi:ribosomal protein S18 acetylase RimI-like enzyme
MITLMVEDYLDEVVRVHLKSFKGFFLSFLGERFLKLYYKGIINHENAIKLVYMETNTVKGFVIGVMNPSGFYSTLLRRDWFRFGIASLPAIFKKPKYFLRLLHAFTKPSNTPKDHRVAELSSIAVLPDIQGKGIGRELVKSFVNEVTRLGCRAIYLTTDTHNNDAVNAFYERIGFKIKQTIRTQENRLMNEFWLEIK